MSTTTLSFANPLFVEPHYEGIRPRKQVQFRVRESLHGIKFEAITGQM